MSLRRKQLSFDLDTDICKKILGDERYTKAYKDMRSFFERHDCSHIEGSVYMTDHGVSNIRISQMLEELLAEHPYLSKCIREIHQADVTNVHSLNQYFSYDGTPGQYERPPDQKANRHKREPPKKPSVREQLVKNKAAMQEKDKTTYSGARENSRQDRDISR